MKHIKEDLEDILTEITFNCMRNEHNKSFYIKNLTKTRIQNILEGLDKKAHRIFWNAYFAIVDLLNFKPEGEIYELYNSI